jgi:hypothetical protein
MVLLYYSLLHYFGMFGMWKGAEASFYLSCAWSVHPQLEWFEILDAFEQKYLPRNSGIFGMWKGAKDTIDHSNLLDPDHHHRFLYLTNNEKFVLSILFSNKTTLCALRPVIFSHFLTCFKTFCRGQYGESHYNWQYSEVTGGKWIGNASSSSSVAKLIVGVD